MFGRRLHVTVTNVADGERAIREALERQAIELSGTRRITPSLEDVFVARVQASGGAPTD